MKCTFLENKLHECVKLEKINPSFSFLKENLFSKRKYTSQSFVLLLQAGIAQLLSWELSILAF